MGFAKGGIIFSIKDICDILRTRQKNKFDANFGVSGRRGNGKSTLIYKVLIRFSKDGFNNKKHQVYERNDVMDLLANQKLGFCWDDEAINSGYKRDFQQKGQHELIKLVTNYRDNFNIYASALPFFFSLDRDLRELVFMHIHIIERGLAVVFMQKQDQIHALDPWDTKFNQKIEDSESTRMARNPLAKMRYERFSTFAGYVYFNEMTKKQEARYIEIKHKKRANRFDKDIVEKQENNFYDYAFAQLTEGILTQDALRQMCAIAGKRLTSVETGLNARLRDKKMKTVAQFYIKTASVKEKIPEKRLSLAVPVLNVAPLK